MPKNNAPLLTELSLQKEIVNAIIQIYKLNTNKL